MEGLVKGLINAVLGGDEDNAERREGQGHHPQSQSHDVEQQSRSSWAQVVSGDNDDEGYSRDHGRNEYNRQEGNYGRNEAWESSGSRPAMRPQKATWQDNERNDERRQDNYDQSQWNQQQGGESKDGWETVHKKPSKRHQKVHMDHWDNYKRPPEEQTYSNEVEYRSHMEPSEEELRDLSKACNKLWELDLNRLTPGKDYEIDIGEGKKVYQKGDCAEGSLFSWVNEDIFKRPTFSRFCSLLDNYNPHEGYKENVTSQEKQEQTAFIEEISRTAPIKYLYNYLISKGIVSHNYEEFKRVMTSLWFDLYNRGGTHGSSSAFEHVFVGEIKQRGEQEVSGFHNWLQFYLEEAKGRVDYQGYILPRRHGQFPDSETQLLTIQFEWNGVLKSVSSCLVGVSPEFEVALYTLCFFVGGEDNQVELGPYPVNVKCYRLGNKLGSAFPIADS
ncbi:poly(U)-specific endoribonuclease-B isoform X1 [Coffea eugenioides]|uniref:poly(U)-specific endoribonuclease-B isoform X1 n=1 Tax=Coffea eugenioides TaxID=49369 RepID=UPI000F60710B|nr:poly(U)-specific endoribonuclease-B isoform X1 [Coffea eugenioides]